MRERALPQHLRRNAVAYLALFVALGGTSFAAAGAITGRDVKNGSLTGRDLKNGSVTGKDVRNRSLTPRDFRGSVQGATGAQGPKGDRGAQGVRGLRGPAGPITGELPSGVTVRGSYALSYPDGNWTGSNPAWTAISYGFRLPSDPTVSFVPPGGPNPTGCSGTISSPEAAPGQLCIYRGAEIGFGAPGPNRQRDDGFSEFGANTTGIFLGFALTGTTLHLARGSWAVTGP
jgi:hypothetical protein